MTDITELAQRMKAAAEKATPGEWWADEVKNEGCYGSGDDCVEGFTSYAIYGSDGQTLFDSLNSDAACISEEYDGEGHVAWDETAQRNAEFIALANPANILALVEALEKAQAKATQQGNIACALFDEVTQLRLHADEKAPELRAQLIEADSELEALRNRIAELESHKAALLKFIRDSCYVFDGADEDISDAYVDAITSGLIPKLESVTACNPPLFWVRVKSDGGYEGPIHDSKLEEVRKKSGEWLPLTLAGGIPELESRTVTVKLPERYACELGYNAPDPNGAMLDRDDVIAALTAAGIKVEAE
ncbi:ead/Ea22-like family protein [Klebsiella pneumoniae]|uniref:ead/Ea22-like family protein n=1 Tax=Klebsiella pneumoniae TaxID=573 RepID=UPI000D7473A4|nr:ead/Ea22-like family protein [Klebsiella pneumoniae]PXJ35895.1 hypothetical protein DMR26_16910 [Klebsiella pneumoniae]